MMTRFANHFLFRPPLTLRAFLGHGTFFCRPGAPSEGRAQLHIHTRNPDWSSLIVCELTVTSSCPIHYHWTSDKKFRGKYFDEEARALQMCVHVFLLIHSSGFMCIWASRQFNLFISSKCRIKIYRHFSAVADFVFFFLFVFRFFSGLEKSMIFRKHETCFCRLNYDKFACSASILLLHCFFRILPFLVAK